MQAVTEDVAAYYSTNSDEIRKITRGPQQGNEARKLAMYLCQELSGAKLTEIADYFNLHYDGSVSFINHQVRQLKREDKAFNRTVEGGVTKSLTKQET